LKEHLNIKTRESHCVVLFYHYKRDVAWKYNTNKTKENERKVEIFQFVSPTCTRMYLPFCDNVKISMIKTFILND
jgi:hypothetical protein